MTEGQLEKIAEIDRQIAEINRQARELGVEIGDENGPEANDNVIPFRKS